MKGVAGVHVNKCQGKKGAHSNTHYTKLLYLENLFILIFCLYLVFPDLSDHLHISGSYRNSQHPILSEISFSYRFLFAPLTDSFGI